MPITACFACMAFLAMILLVPVLPISLILLGSGKRRAAAALLGFPVGMLILSALLTILVLAAMWQYGVRMSHNPVRLFEKTFGFQPPLDIEMLEGYCEPGLDSETRVMMFRAPPGVIERMCRGGFAPSDRATFVQAYGGDWNDLPEHVRSWFLPAVARAQRFYVAEPFDDSFHVYDKAVLCYSEQTGIACFHWSDVD